MTTVDDAPVVHMKGRVRMESDDYVSAVNSFNIVFHKVHHVMIGLVNVPDVGTDFVWIGQDFHNIPRT